MNLREHIATNRPSILEFDDKITAPFFGYEGRDDYYHKASCIHRLPNIRIPTVFLNTLDDPIVSRDCIDFEVFKHNPNIVLSTTNHGGHTGYHESLFSSEQWFGGIAVKYFLSILE